MLKSPERSTTTVTIYEGADYARFEELDRQLREAAEHHGGPPRRVGDIPEAVAAAQAMDKFKAEAIGRGMVVTVQAVARRKYRELVGAHPAREDNVIDQQFGFNADTFPDDFVPASLPLEGQFESDEDRRRWVEELSEGNFLRIYQTALAATNEAKVVDPLVDVSSRVGRTGDEKQGQPARLG